MLRYCLRAGNWSVNKSTPRYYNMKIVGLDISLDHGGVVILTKEGELENYCALTTVKKYVDVDSEHVLLLTKQEKEEPKESFRLRRIEEYWDRLDSFIHQDWGEPIYFSVEGYSYSSQSTSICQIAELTGYLKYKIFEKGRFTRIHDPLSVKLFATNKGNCLKKEIVEKVQQYLSIPQGLIKKKEIKKRGEKIEEYNGPATDIADAYFLAKMLWTELMVREGKVTLEQLSEGERRIFLRTTKTYPVNLLARPFIHKENDEEL